MCREAVRGEKGVVVKKEEERKRTKRKMEKMATSDSGH
jgi:hypothetical protein